MPGVKHYIISIYARDQTLHPFYQLNNEKDKTQHPGSKREL